MAKVQVTFDWDAIKADPVEFTKKLLRFPDGSPCQPFEAQEWILRNVKRNTVGVTGRQFSKTTSFGWYTAWYAMTHSNKFVWIFAPTLDQSRIMFNEIADYFRKAPLKSEVVGKIKNAPFPYLELKNGTKIQARGLNRPEYIRGNRAHLAIVDEASFVKEGAIRETVEPLFLVTGREPDSALILVSTPWGNGEFYEMFENAKKRVDQGSDRFSHFHYTSLDNPYADKEQLEEVKERYGEDSPIWQAEYLGIFQDDDLAVFRSADIKWAYENWPEKLKFPVGVEEKHKYVQGVDLANRSDFFVSTVLDITERDRVLLARLERYQRKGYEFYKRRVRTNFAAYNHAKTIVDATSLGESVAEDLRDINAVGYKFSGNEAKWEVVQELVRMFQEHRLLIPFERDLVAELGYFRYFITPSKVLRMEAPRGKHDDIVMSLSLAAHLACIPVTLGVFRSVDLSPRHKPERLDDPWAALFREEPEHANTNR